MAGKASIGSFHSVPDFERIGKSDYDAFLKIENFSFFETMYINDSVDKSKAYSRIMLYRSVSRAQETLFSASDFLEQNAVFIEPDLLKKVRDFIALLRSVWAERQTALDAPSVGFKEWQKLDKEGAKMMSEIETEVRAALGSQILKA